ncbi:uncharacterized protein FIBRA_06282 [Fibroporia radiculosa]|uniref:Uncharacterized protein n=1 Tax=Fibroporia radiculosa TaxID=599839 RepID=J4IB65_9APHY|nr:uncharacterized protein FIBRA_06282 [Fibroporia radiculosa]CCM04121.1 predicted protein [Fibroporia radiculosa]
MPPTPSSIISDALGSLSKAANLALATIEDQARTDVARANAEASDGRRERDEALKALHALRLEEKEWERREEAWKAAVDKSELTVKHQTETITQLRGEALQWKTQLLRLEESSRQEIGDWKEQYLRAEQERCRLSSRIDELVAEQLVWNTHTNAATVLAAPRTPYPEFYDSSASSTLSTSTKQASTTVSHMPTLAKSGTPRSQDLVEVVVPSSHKSKAIMPLYRAHEPSLRSPVATPSRVTKQKVPPRITHAASTPTSRADLGSRGEAQVKVQQQPVQHVVRRVQATISVPVKEEDDSGADDLESDASGSAYEPEDEQLIRQRKSGRTSARRQIRLISEDGLDGPKEQQRHAQRGSGRHRLVQADDSDVDELAMGAEEDNNDAQRLVQRPSLPEQSSRNKTTGRPSTANTTKKRKHDESVPAENARGVTAKVARKK